MSQENKQVITIPDGIKQFLPEELKELSIDLNNIGENTKNIQQLTNELREVFFSNKQIQISADELLNLIKSILTSKIDLNNQIVDNTLEILKAAIYEKITTKDNLKSIFDILKTICASKQITDSEVHSIFYSFFDFLLSLTNQLNASNESLFLRECLELAELVLTSEIKLEDKTVYEVYDRLKYFCLDKISMPDDITKFLDTLQNICINEKTSDNAIYRIFKDLLFDWPNSKTVKTKDFPMENFFKLIKSILSTKSNLSEETVKEVLWNLRNAIFFQKPDVKLILNEFRDICGKANSSQQANVVIDHIFLDMFMLMDVYKFEIKDILSIIEEILKSNVVLDGKTVLGVLEFVARVVETEQLSECDLTPIFKLLERAFDKEKHKVESNDIFWIFDNLNKLITNRKICFSQPPNSLASAISSLTDKILELNLEIMDDALENIMLVLLTSIRSEKRLKFGNLVSFFDVVKQSLNNGKDCLTSNELENIFNALMKSMKSGIKENSGELPIFTLEKICNNSDDKLISVKVCCLFNILFELADNPDKSETHTFSSKEVLTLLQKFLNSDIKFGFSDWHMLSCIFDLLLKKIEIEKEIFKYEDVFDVLKKVYRADNNKLTKDKVSQMLDVLLAFVCEPKKYNLSVSAFKNDLLNLIQEVLISKTPLDCQASETIFLNVLPKAIENSLCDIDEIVQMFNNVCNSDSGQLNDYKIDGMFSDVLKKIVSKSDKDKTKNFPTDNVLALAKKILQIETKPYGFRLQAVFDTLFLIAGWGAGENAKVTNMLNDLGIYFESKDKTFVVTKINSDKLKNYASKDRIAEICKIYKIDNLYQEQQEDNVENKIDIGTESQNIEESQPNIDVADVATELNINTNIDLNKSDHENKNTETETIQENAEINDNNYDNNPNVNNNLLNVNDDHQNEMKDDIEKEQSEKENNNNDVGNENSDKEKKIQETNNDNNIINLNDNNNRIQEKLTSDIKDIEKEDNSNSDENKNSNINEESIGDYFKECRYDSIKILDQFGFNTTKLELCLQFTKNQISVTDNLKASLKIWFYMFFRHPLILFFDKNYSFWFHRDFDICCKQSQKEMSLKGFTFKNDGRQSILKLIADLRTQQKIKDDNQQSKLKNIEKEEE